MKKPVLTLLGVCLCFSIFAQDDNVNTKEINNYVFKDFVTGTVKKKSGELVSAQLNYNTFTEEMIFIKDTQKLALAQLEDIDTVFIAGKVFVPVANVFYEKATVTPVALYIQHKTIILPPGKDIGYGSKTQLGSVANASAIRNGNKSYNLQLPDDYTAASRTAYWLNKDGRYIEITTLKKVQSVFPAKAAAIKSFADANKIKWDNGDDMVKLIVFCNQPG